MAFKYINPGYAELLSVRGGTTVTGEQYSKTGISFWQTQMNRGLLLSEIPTELYGRFDVFLKNPTIVEDALVWVCIGYYNGIKISPDRTVWDIEIRKDGRNIYSLSDTAGVIRTDAVNTLWFHIKQGKHADGIMHVMVNGYEIYHAQNEELWYAGDSEAKTVTLCSKSSDALLSNLILSNEEISPREQVIMLPVKETHTNMTDCGDGSYEATAANQELLQSVDTASLITQYGADSRVTGISLLGNPAYCTAEGLCALMALEKSGGNITEYGRHIAEQNPNSTVMDTRTVSMTIAELSGRQFGWRAGT
ncbi:hypothetical protein [Selenomonas sp. oral taxon 136]|uniref:hypothetical protein n=1 Tax=Selenomonas sp. oral taxon 136 TaxID=713030 RepID=UPI000767E5CA|nr:hypothetical protein [Selenomonas sp. oral taxon 136]AME02661.1 hypothetical protein AXE86_00350 [Selenomonas sp. oral taxon 136]